MKFWTRLRWFAALAFLALLLWGWWASDDGRQAAKESVRPGVFNF
jgi:hypothetical protein